MAREAYVALRLREDHKRNRYMLESLLTRLRTSSNPTYILKIGGINEIDMSRLQVNARI